MSARRPRPEDSTLAAGPADAKRRRGVARVRDARELQEDRMRLMLAMAPEDRFQMDGRTPVSVPGDPRPLWAYQLVAAAFLETGRYERSLCSAMGSACRQVVEGPPCPKCLRATCPVCAEWFNCCCVAHPAMAQGYARTHPCCECGDEIRINDQLDQPYNVTRHYPWRLSRCVPCQSRLCVPLPGRWYPTRGGLGQSAVWSTRFAPRFYATGMGPAGRLRFPSVVMDATATMYSSVPVHSRPSDRAAIAAAPDRRTRTSMATFWGYYARSTGPCIVTADKLPRTLHVGAEDVEEGMAYVAAFTHQTGHAPFNSAAGVVCALDLATDQRLPDDVLDLIEGFVPAGSGEGTRVLLSPTSALAADDRDRLSVADVGTPALLRVVRRHVPTYERATLSTPVEDPHNTLRAICTYFGV